MPFFDPSGQMVALSGSGTTQFTSLNAQSGTGPGFALDGGVCRLSHVMVVTSGAHDHPAVLGATEIPQRGPASPERRCRVMSRMRSHSSVMWVVGVCPPSPALFTSMSMRRMRVMAESMTVSTWAVGVAWSICT
jgi:hypothetical protein